MSDTERKATRNNLARKSAVIACPICGSAGKIFDCRASPHGFRRSYACNANAAHEWTTLEVKATKFRGVYYPAINEDR